MAVPACTLRSSHLVLLFLTCTPVPSFFVMRGLAHFVNAFPRGGGTRHGRGSDRRRARSGAVAKPERPSIGIGRRMGAVGEGDGGESTSGCGWAPSEQVPDEMRPSSELRVSSSFTGRAIPGRPSDKPAGGANKVCGFRAIRTRDEAIRRNRQSLSTANGARGSSALTVARGSYLRCVYAARGIPRSMTLS
jgi:hypothetical protein